MNALTNWPLRAAKVSLIAAAIVVATLALARDGRPAEAAGSTEIVLSLSDQTIEEVGSIILMIGADPVSYYVWAKDVKEPTGVSAFQIGFEYGSTTVSVNPYDPTAIEDPGIDFDGDTVSDEGPCDDGIDNASDGTADAADSDCHPSGVVQDSTWLASTGRGVSCPATWIDANDGPGESGIGTVQSSCNTFQVPPPYGPQGSGLLGTITLQLVGTVGLAPLDFRYMSQLVNTPPDPNDIAEIPLNAPLLNVQVVECPDFTGDDTIRVDDIMYVVQRYHGSDLTADLNQDGAVTVQDILIVVKLYHQDCPPPA